MVSATPTVNLCSCHQRRRLVTSIQILLRLLQWRVASFLPSWGLSMPFFLQGWSSLITWFIRHIQQITLFQNYIKIFRFSKFDFFPIKQTTCLWLTPFVTLFPALLLFWLAVTPMTRYLASISFFLFFFG